MSLDTLNNGDSGLDARTKINAAIAAIENKSVLPRSYISGMIMVYNTSTLLNVSAGVCRDDTDTYDITLNTIIKDISSNFVAGSGNGGLQIGLTLTVNTNYSVWVIKETTSGSVDVMFSTSASAPTLPGTFDAKRRIGWVRYGAGAIQQFIQKGDCLRYVNGPIDSFGTSLIGTASSDTLITLSAPPDVLTTFRFYGTCSAGTWLVRLAMTADASNITVNNLFTTFAGSGTANPDAGQATLLTDASSQIRARASGGTVSFTASTLGWIDTRGRDD